MHQTTASARSSFRLVLSVAHAGQTLEVCILGPQLGAVDGCWSRNDAVCHRKSALYTDSRSRQDHTCIKINHLPLLHGRDGLKCSALIALNENALEDLIQRQGWHELRARPDEPVQQVSRAAGRVGIPEGTPCPRAAHSGPQREAYSPRHGPRVRCGGDRRGGSPWFPARPRMRRPRGAASAR